MSQWTAWYSAGTRPVSPSPHWRGSRSCSCPLTIDTRYTFLQTQNIVIISFFSREKLYIIMRLGARIKSNEGRKRTGEVISTSKKILLYIYSLIFSLKIYDLLMMVSRLALWTLQNLRWKKLVAKVLVFRNETCALNLNIELQTRPVSTLFSALLKAPWHCEWLERDESCWKVVFVYSFRQRQWHVWKQWEGSSDLIKTMRRQLLNNIDIGRNKLDTSFLDRLVLQST